MKKLFLPLLAAGLLVNLALTAAQFFRAPAKIGYVNSKALLNGHPLVPQIQKELEERREGFEANLKKLTDELDSLSKVFVELKDRDQKVRMARAIDEKRGNAMRYQSESVKKIRAIEEERLKPVVEAVNLHIKEYAKRNHVELILGAVPDNIIYADEMLDLTPVLGKVVANIQVAGK